MREPLQGHRCGGRIKAGVDAYQLQIFGADPKRRGQCRYMRGDLFSRERELGAVQVEAEACIQR
jgi:hypothetical protein